MKKENNNEKEKTTRISLIHMIIRFINKKQYSRAIMTFIAGIVGCAYFTILIHGIIGMLIYNSFSLNTLIVSIMAIIFSISVIYILGNKI